MTCILIFLFEHPDTRTVPSTSSGLLRGPPIVAAFSSHEVSLIFPLLNFDAFCEAAKLGSGDIPEAEGCVPATDDDRFVRYLPTPLRDSLLD